MASKLEKYAEELVDKALEGEMSLNEAIDELNKRLEVFDRVKVYRDRLVAARRALMGVGGRTTSGTNGNRLTSDEVAKAMSDTFPEGATVSMITAAIPGSNEAQVRGHLNRGRGERFLKRESDNHWFLRDSEEGINDEEDLPDGD